MHSRDSSGQSAQGGTPTFAPQALAAFSAPATPDLLAARHQRRVDARLGTRFRRFIEDECGDYCWHLNASMGDFVSRSSPPATGLLCKHSGS